MKEMQEIVKAFSKAKKNNLQTALATVVHVEGSSYRRAGARMLVTENGDLTGAISGGCLEGDALRKAQLVMARQQSMLVTYDTTGEDDSNLGAGLGCNGIIHILIEPINTENPDNPIQLFKEFLGKREYAVLVTLFSMKNKSAEQPGTCLFMDKNGDTRGNITDEALKSEILNDAIEVLKNQKSITKVFRDEDELTGFVELLEPAISLVIVGAGYDAIPLMNLSSVLGWQTTIVDGRSNYATKSRFHVADNIIVTKPEELMDRFTPDDRTAFVLMTHNYNYDLAVLRDLIALELPFIGLLGPRKRTDRMLDDLKDEGLTIDEKNMFGPVGLDIGAESPEEIALSILAEIKAVFTGKSGSHLREKNQPIHNRESDMIVH
ncbi:MAG TPA: XdhC/CoxI family protein [Balneolales bacterium]|nr:XdhC/CoxI family protein [Balneolales bacterium]